MAVSLKHRALKCAPTFDLTLSGFEARFIFCKLRKIFVFLEKPILDSFNCGVDKHKQGHICCKLYVNNGSEPYKLLIFDGSWFYHFSATPTTCFRHEESPSVIVHFRNKNELISIGALVQTFQTRSSTCKNDDCVAQADSPRSSELECSQVVELDATFRCHLFDPAGLPEDAVVAVSDGTKHYDMANISEATSTVTCSLFDHSFFGKQLKVTAIGLATHFALISKFVCYCYAWHRIDYDDLKKCIRRVQKNSEFIQDEQMINPFYWCY